MEGKTLDGPCIDENNVETRESAFFDCGKALSQSANNKNVRTILGQKNHHYVNQPVMSP
jgi:hypothetical protein